MTPETVAKDLREATARLVAELKKLDLPPELRGQIEQASLGARSSIAMFDAEATKQRTLVGLLDLKARSEVLAISDDETVEVRPLTCEAVFLLLSCMPRQVGAILSGGQMDPEDALSAHWAIAILIACSTMPPSATDEQFISAVEKSAMLPADTQVGILEAIGRVSFAHGFGPLVKVFMVLGKFVREPGRAPVTRSRPSSKKEARTSTPNSGDSRQDNSPRTPSSEAAAA